MQKLITNAKIVLQNEIISGSILIENGKIIQIGKNIPAPDAEIIDASDSYILPGFIDVHTHLADRIGRFELADDYSTGSKIALLNGITTIYSFITQNKDETLLEAISRTLSKAKNKSYCDYSWHLTPTDFSLKSWLEIEQAIADGFNSFKLYTTYRAAGIYTSYQQMEEIYKRFAERNISVMMHCEDDEIIAEEQAKFTEYDNPFTLTLQRPSKAETKAALEIVELCRKYGVRTHLVHVSSPETVSAIREKSAGLPLTLETCPQYLYLDENCLKTQNGHRYLCTPPLRSKSEQSRLRQLALNGDIDIFATDHCAFTNKDKDDWRNDIRVAGNGMAGLGALSHLIVNLFRPLNDQKILSICDRLSKNPAIMTHQFPQKGTISVGADADLLIVDFDGKGKPIQATFSDCYNPYSDLNSTLEIKKVFLRGNLIAENGKIIQKIGRQLYKI